MRSVAGIGMDVGGREILIALGILLLIAILLDGFRRTRGRGAGKLRVRRRKQPIFDDDDNFDDLGPELPLGKARVVGIRDEQSAEQVSLSIKENVAKNNNKLTAPFREPEQASLGFDEVIPSRGDHGAAPPAARQTPGTAAHDGVAKPERATNHDKATKRREVPVRDKAANRDKATIRDEATIRDKAPMDPVQDVIVVHVMAARGERFDGHKLLDVLLENGLRYGSRKIFHRHEDPEGAGKILFSMANSVNPGTFDLDDMDRFTTPGISFLIMFEDHEDPMAAFDLMMETVHAVSSELGGELKDEHRSALTRQTAEHYRQRIMDYNRRQLAGL